ncbi:MAG TPA: 3'-5' exonuclease [Bacteroidales bacterium]|nr:3'-5' exonuclease [Bacteroidales bacterium]
MNYLNNLNTNQREAVEYISGPSLIIAGAGSGKTRVLTYKIAYLLSVGYSPTSLLALTFTNKAANEMKERIASLVGYEKAKGLWMGTFHSVFSKILRFEAEKIDYTQKFTIYDATDAKNLTKSIIKEMDLDEENYKPAPIYGRISMAKNNLITVDAYSQNERLILDDMHAKRPEFKNIYAKYCQRCKQSNVMDFDDLLLNVNLLFKRHPDILKKYSEKFKFILVDEYQDTNYAQYLIVKKLSENHRMLSVVGDDAQSIYSFRGAKIENILNFKNDYPDYKLFRLEQNYRSTKTIVDAANSIITHNRSQIKKNVFSKNEQGEKIKIEKLLTDNEEGFFIARSISEMKNKLHDTYSDYAILYRTNSQSRILEESLRRMNMPYQVYGGQSFYNRKEVKDLIAYLRLAINPIDEEALRRVINYPSRKIGDTTLKKLFAFSDRNNISVWKIINHPMQYPIDINSGTASRLKAFAELVLSLMKETDQLNATDFIEFTYTQSGLKLELEKDKTPQGVSRIENVQELVSAAQAYVELKFEENPEHVVSIEEYLENVALLSDLDKADDDDNDKITLMTIHSAKGLEFKNVFVTGLEENLFPGALSIDNPKELEEERRLFYVAITRAKLNLILSYCSSRFKYGSITNPKPSRFLNEIDDKFISWPEYDKFIKASDFNDDGDVIEKSISRKIFLKKSPIKRNEALNSQNNSNFDDLEELPQELIIPGVHVLHKLYGKGKVLKLENVSGNKMAIVFFENSGQKKMMLKFARFRKFE